MRGYATRVIESGYFLPHLMISGYPPGASIRPIEPGISIGPISVMTAGTLGAIVTDGSRYYVLSNNHVLAGVNVVPLGTPILQPALYDGGGPHDAIAKLSAFVPLVPGRDMRVDCAIAQLDPDVPWNNVSRGGIEIQGVAEPALDMEVEKLGRTTGHTIGTITSIAVGVDVPYQDAAGNAATIDFVDQITIRTEDGSPFSSPGDSGAVVLERHTGRAVALVTAGAGSFTMANPISRVLDELGGLIFA